MLVRAVQVCISLRVCDGGVLPVSDAAVPAPGRVAVRRPCACPCMHESGVPRPRRAAGAPRRRGCHASVPERHILAHIHAAGRCALACCRRRTSLHWCSAADHRAACRHAQAYGNAPPSRSAEARQARPTGEARSHPRAGGSNPRARRCWPPSSPRWRAPRPPSRSAPAWPPSQPRCSRSSARATTY